MIGSAATVSMLSVATLGFAQSSSSLTSSVASKTIDPAACSAALDQQLTVVAPAKDTLNAAEKSAMQTRIGALKVALGFTDETQRTEAIKSANEAFGTSMETAVTTFQDATKTAMEAMRTSCGKVFGPHGGMMMKFKMKGPGPMGGQMMHGDRHGMKGMKFFDKKVDDSNTAND